ncbi:hypothetical protein BN946_scf184936.g28 [Trametes cinnabarina]|uniref:CCT-theta n=1 Tax=Pycnoporus cinnabarinus TaxID=5643 RepID=A0A060SYG9_PYCCI|nr:hypothetical protein BN946_scf184936.g28 [Trametes cinnabarina]
MSLKVPKAQNLQLFKDGYKHLQGLDEAVLRNIQAVAELSDLVRTSFGPNGRNKLVINYMGKLFVTSDAATIIREIEVVHPAAKLLVMASQAQEQEMGDSTNTVMILAGEMLKKAEQLLIMGLVPSEIIKGYELASEKALAELESLSTSTLPSPPTKSALATALKPAIASKQYGYEDTLANLVAEAALTVMPPNPKNFNVDNIFQEIADSGVKVVIAGSTVGELALHYLNRMNIAVLKVLSKFELRRLCRVVNATPLARLGAPTAEEAGFVDVFETTEIGGDRVTVLRQVVEGDPDFDPSTADARSEKTRTATIVLRGATQNRLDDLERAVDDGVNVIKALRQGPPACPWGGRDGARARTARGGALEVVPRTLAENALGGGEGNEVVSRLWAKHEGPGGEAWGVDVEAETDGTLSATEHQILDSLAAKQWAIKLATEAATSVLSVDSIIMSRPAGGPKIPQQSGNWDED